MTASATLFFVFSPNRSPKKLTRSQEWSREGGGDDKGCGGELHLLVGTSKARNSDGNQTNGRADGGGETVSGGALLRSSLSVGRENTVIPYKLPRYIILQKTRHEARWPQKPNKPNKGCFGVWCCVDMIVLLAYRIVCITLPLREVLCSSRFSYQYKF